MHLHVVRSLPKGDDCVNLQGMPINDEAVFASIQKLDPKEAVEAFKRRGAAIRRELRNEVLEEVVQLLRANRSHWDIPESICSKMEQAVRALKVEVPRE